MKPLLFTTAMVIESGGMERKLGPPCWADGPRALFQGSAAGHELWLLRTGVGKKSAAKAMDGALTYIEPAAVISLGTCGALRPDLGVGDCLLVSELKEHRREGFEVTASTDDHFSELLMKALSRQGTPYIHGALFTSKKVVPQPEQKRQAGKSSECAAIDMESAVIARKATQSNLPFACLRVVLDSLDDPLPHLDIINRSGVIEAGALVRALLRAPRLLPSLLTFTWRCLSTGRLLGRLMQNTVALYGNGSC